MGSGHGFGTSGFEQGARATETKTRSIITVTAARVVHNLQMSRDDSGSTGDSDSGLRVTPIDDGISVSGEVDVATWSSFWSALHRTVTSPRKRDVFVELKGLTFIDGHGIELIARAARELPPKVRLVLRHPPSSLRRVAQIARLDREPGIVIEETDDDQ